MIYIKKIKPMFTALVTTMDVYEEDTMTAGGIIEANKQKGTIKEYQTVVSVGDSVRGIKEGDLVSINPSRFAVKKNQENSIKNDIEGGNPVLEYRFDIIHLDGKPHLLLQDRDIEFVIEEWEEIKTNNSSIIQPTSGLIV